MSDPIVESHNSEAQQQVAVLEEARQKASEAQIQDSIERGLAKFFDRGVQEKRFVDIGRIPFICDDIRGIHATQKSIEDTLALVRNIVFGFITLIVLGFMGALMTIVFK